MASRKDVTVYIGRFNPFHRGHAHVLDRAIQSSKLVVLLIGSAHQARSLKNPFTFAERSSMINTWIASRKNASADDAEVVICAVRDYPYSNNTWIKSVQSTVKAAVQNFCIPRQTILTSIYLTGSDRDDSTWYLKAFPQWKLDLVDPLDNPAKLSATSVRQVLYESNLLPEDFASLVTKCPRSTCAFFEKFAADGKLDILREEYQMIKDYKAKWSVAPYAPTFMTADAVIIQSGHVLVVRRAKMPGKGLIALPGGFVKQNQRVQEAAVDEVMEETGLLLTTGKKAVEITKAMLLGSIKTWDLFDDPERSARGRTITVAYLMRLDDTKPLPLVSGQLVPEYERLVEGDVETLEAFWMPLEQALSNSSQWFEDHHSILSIMASKKDI